VIVLRPRRQQPIEPVGPDTVVRVAAIGGKMVGRGDAAGDGDGAEVGAVRVKRLPNQYCRVIELRGDGLAVLFAT
jgi:hypothetical protein